VKKFNGLKLLTSRIIDKLKEIEEETTVHTEPKDLIKDSGWTEALDWVIRQIHKAEVEQRQHEESLR
jgi:hypothetical protein